MPADTAVLRTLAAVLDLDEGELFELAGVEPEEEPARPTVDEALASLAEIFPGPAAGDEPAPDLPVSGPVGPAPAEEEPGEPGEREEVSEDEDPEEGWGNVVPPTVPEVTRAPRAAPAYTGSYLDDPEEKAVYRRRAVRTAVGVAVSALVGFLALRGLTDALGAVWDVIAASW